MYEAYYVRPCSHPVVVIAQEYQALLQVLLHGAQHDWKLVRLTQASRTLAVGDLEEVFQDVLRLAEKMKAEGTT